MTRGTPPLPRLCRSLIAVGLALLASAPVLAQGYRRPGLVLPLQNRVGDDEAVAMVEKILRDELTQVANVVQPEGLRDALRRLRMRDVNGASPKRLDILADEVGVEWFFSATLFRVDPGPLPVITLSAQVHRRGDPDLVWAGFVSASGLDTRRSLGRGRIFDLPTLARREIRSLVTRMTLPPSSGTKEKPSTPSKSGFLRGPLSSERLGRVAVIPFESVTDLRPEVSAELVTDLGIAVLHRSGLRVAAPGAVDHAQRHRGILLRGRVDEPTRVALRDLFEVDTILTGTVKDLGLVRGGEEPNPEVSFSTRIIDSRSGQILWIDGAYRTGWDDQKTLGRGRTYTAGAVAGEIFESMVAGFINGTGGQ